MDLAAILARFLDRPRVVLVRAVLDAYGAAPGGLLASGLAFAALFAIVPITVLTVGLGGWLADDATQTVLVAALVRLLPPLSTLIEQALDALVQGAAVTSVVGLVGTVWTVSRFYTALDTAFARVFAQEPGRSALRQTVRSFLWVAILIGLVVSYIVGVTLTTALSTISDSVPGTRQLARFLGSPLTILAVVVVLLLVLYRTVPPSAPRWRSVVLPGVVVAVAILLVSQAFAMFAPRLVGVAAIVGSLAVVFIALAWLSFIFQLVLIGAAWVRVRDEQPVGPDGSGDGTVDQP